MTKILMTGGHGLLGSELKPWLPSLLAPDEKQLDITDASRVAIFFHEHEPEVVLHLAAFTSVTRAEAEKDLCWRVNVEGTRNIVRAANGVGAFLVHISTDYVFGGERGMYREDDVIGPPVNYYALSKIVAEEAARAAKRYLIMRTSFRPSLWPYSTAFTDAYTSQDYVDIIAPMIADVILERSRIACDTLHIGTERKSIFELAKRRCPGVRPTSRTSAGVGYPKDVSLDCSRWESLRAIGKGG